MTLITTNVIGERDTRCHSSLIGSDGLSNEPNKGQHMTRKDYILIADVIKQNHAPHNDSETLWRVACALADVLENDNPRFDHSRFMQACGVSA